MNWRGRLDTDEVKRINDLRNKHLAPYPPETYDPIIILKMASILDDAQKIINAHQEVNSNLSEILKAVSDMYQTQNEKDAVGYVEARLRLMRAWDEWLD